MKPRVKLLGIGYIAASLALAAFILLQAAIRKAGGRLPGSRAEAVLMAPAADGFEIETAAPFSMRGEDSRRGRRRSSGELQLREGRLEILSRDARGTLEERKASRKSLIGRSISSAR